VKTDLAKLNEELAVYDDIDSHPENVEGQHWFILAGIYGIALKIARAIVEDYEVKITEWIPDREIFDAIADLHPVRADDIRYICKIKPFYDWISRHQDVPIPFDANTPDNRVVSARARNATIRLLALAVQVRSHVIV
jgi:hypothetical protein